LTGTTSWDPAAAVVGRAWFPQDPDPSPRRLRKHALAEELRGLVSDLLYLDVEAADEDGLAAAEARVRDARAAVAGLPDLRGQNLHVTDHDASLFERSPLSGRSNALAAPLVLEFRGPLTFGHATYGEQYEGPPGSVHGGFVISAFDDLLGVAQAASGVAGLTGTLTVRLRSRTPLNTRIEYEAGVKEHSGRKVIAWGRSLLDGEVLAEAEGIFIQPRGGHPDRVLHEDSDAGRAAVRAAAAAVERPRR
jgi:acyl-coenzyme A thioesterase PaaI-like protein